MAVTKLMHIGSPKGKGAAHLKSSIRYIMNPDKTENGVFIGGNSGNTPEEVFAIMMETKKEWGKTDKRQGYHFVISFPPGEATAEQAYQVIQDFCEEYLGEAYDYVFSVHTDQQHIHGHIVFNSVSRTTGYKYRYEKGDWEKWIQPVTDRICKKYGLPPLVYEKNFKEGKSYAEHSAKKEGRPTMEKIIKADIDHAISVSETMEEFKRTMERMGYQIKKNRNRKTTLFLPPGFERGRRDTTLGEGYRMEEIRQRILGKETKKSEGILSPQLKKSYEADLKDWMEISLTRYQIHFVKRFYLAGHYLEQINPFAVNQAEVRKNALHIQELYEECRYIIGHGIRDISGLENRWEELRREEEALRKRKGRSGEEEGLKRSLRELRREKRMVKKILQEEEQEKRLQPVLKK